MLRLEFLSVMLAVALFGSAAVTKADIVLTGNFNGLASGGGVGTPTLTITHDLTFNITATGLASFLVFDEWTTADGSNLNTTTNSPQNLAVVNNGSSQQQIIMILRDNLGSNINNVSANDGFIQFVPASVTSGTVFTVKAGSYTFASQSGFNPLLENFTFTGNVFLATSSFNRISDIVSAGGPTAVPEPSALGLVSIAGMGFGLIRRRRQAA